MAVSVVRCGEYLDSARYILNDDATLGVYCCRNVTLLLTGTEECAYIPSSDEGRR